MCKVKIFLKFLHKEIINSRMLVMTQGETYGIFQTTQKDIICIDNSGFYANVR